MHSHFSVICSQSSSTSEQQVLLTSEVSLLPLQPLKHSTLQCLIIHITISSQAAFQRTKQMKILWCKVITERWMRQLSMHILQCNGLSGVQCVWPDLVMKEQHFWNYLVGQTQGRQAFRLHTVSIQQPEFTVVPLNIKFTRLTFLIPKN